MFSLKQVLRVFGLGLQTIPSRASAAFVVIGGFAGAVGVLVAVQSISGGLLSLMQRSGRDDRVVVHSPRPIDKSAVLTVAELPQVMRSAAGESVASGEVFAYAFAPKKSNSQEARVTVHGFAGDLPQLLPELRLTQGRMFRPGMHELIVGAGAANQFVGLSVGSSVKLPGGDWLIVGSFSSSHSLLESQLLTDVTTLMGSMRVSEYDSILVRMNPSADFDSFKNALTVLPDFQFEVDRERAYYIQRSQSFYTLLQVITYVIGSIIFAGAIVSALNTMYSVVRSRTVEIGTLRAIGFRGSIVAMGVLFEASLLGALGAMLGAAIAWFCFNGNTVSLLGGSNNTQLVIELTIPSSGLMNGILLGLLAGLAGGLLPAVSAARQPITKALREV